MKISPDDGTIVHGCVEPCPLCGDNAYLHTNGDVRPRFWVKCDNLDCGCTLNSDENLGTVLKRWNKRERA